MEIVYRAAFVFGFLWLVTRITGRSTLGELSTFQLLLYVTMGDLVQQGVTQQDYSVTSAVLAVGVFVLLTVVVSIANSRIRPLRPLVHGVPIVVVDNGEPVLPAMRRERISIDDLFEAAREQGIERLSDVRVAVLEANGRMSFFTADSAKDSAKDGAAESPGVS